MGILEALQMLAAMREQPQREAEHLAQVEHDWRESFVGTIDEFIAREGRA